MDADDGRTYALRCRPRAGRVFGDIPLELAWLAALRRDTDLRPVEPLPGLDGALLQELAVPEPYDCVLFAWILTDLYDDPAGLRVIHADLHHENVKIERGRLRPLDFYEAVWRYPVQDVALTMFDLRFYAKSEQHDYAALRGAFAEGYASRLPWPEQHPGQIEHARRQPPAAPGHLDSLARYGPIRRRPRRRHRPGPRRALLRPPRGRAPPAARADLTPPSP